MNKTIGILAHVDAGKTTFAEQILYHTKSIRTRGRVDHKDSFLDSHSIEKERGITVFSDQAVFEYNDSTYFLIDTPGHVDFSTEMERALKVMDYAVVIISAVEGIQGHTETVWQLLRKYNVPTFLFINKLDRVGANVEAVLKDIKHSFSADVCYISDELKDDNMSEKLIEFIAERDNILLEKYLDGSFDKDLWLNTMKKLIKENKLFPCMSGSALQDTGIDEFLERLDSLTFTTYDSNSKFCGEVYKIRHYEQENRVTYIKALSGTLKVKDELKVKDNTEKVNQIRLYNGDKFKAVDEVKAGQLFAVTGLTNAKIGDGVGEYNKKENYDIVATLKSKVIYDMTLNSKVVLNYFKILEAEDPALNVEWDERLKELQVHVMGKIQLEVLKEIMQERFKLNIEFGPCQILYKETITEEATGYGHFEPLGHYAEVHVKIEPADRNSGIHFVNACHADDLTTGHQNLIKTHIFEREHHGILTGSPITDIKITLLTGRASNKHTSGGDFREATFRALRQGLEQTKNILLEPYYRFKFEVELDYMGRVLSDIQKLYGSFNPPETVENNAVIVGRGPVATFMEYSIELASFTKGKGKYGFVFDGYDVCHNEEEVIKNSGYDKRVDMDYSSTSIFCSKGESYLVEGDRAKEFMHCLKK